MLEKALAAKGKKEILRRFEPAGNDLFDYGKPVEEAGLLKRNAFSPNAYYKQVIDDVNNVPGVKAQNSHTANTAALEKATTKLKENLNEKLKSAPPIPSQTSDDAMLVAKENAATYDLTIDFIRGDILEKNFSIEKTFDLIISNPPYITAAEKKDMHERVLAFEPKEALFVTNHDPLQFYKAILTFSKHHLSPDGKIFLELNRDYGIQTQQLYDEAGFETELRKDMYGNTRMLMAQKNGRKTQLMQTLGACLTVICVTTDSINIKSK